MIYLERYTETIDPNVTKKLRVNNMDEKELNREKTLKNPKKDQENVSGPITNTDVARILGMPESMIEKLFGKEAGNSEDSMTGESEDENGAYHKETDEHE